jgi:4-hydroxy-tetrahydrodipicolinate reductase
MNDCETRVAILGFGAMGTLMARCLADRVRTRLVAVIDQDPSKIGSEVESELDVPGISGVCVESDLVTALEQTQPHIVLAATTAFAAEALTQLLPMLSRGISVITISQELVYPIGSSVAVAQTIDAACRASGARMTAVGVNPGFAMDLVPLVASAACWQVNSIEVDRSVDFSPYGSDEMAHIGAGLTRAAYELGVVRGDIGHIGLLESASMVASYLAIDLDELVQTNTPLIAQSERRTAAVTVPSGRVCGFTQEVVGTLGGQRRVRFTMRGVLDPRPEEDGFTLGDCATLHGSPDVEIRMMRGPCNFGGMATAAIAVNAIPRVLGAAPGFLLAPQLALPMLSCGRRGEPARTIRRH